MTKTSHLLLSALICLGVLGACGGNDDSVAASTTSGLEDPSTTEQGDGPDVADHDGPSATTAAGPPAATVTLKSLSFDPKVATIEAGESVRWVWDDGVIVHNVSGKGFKSKDQEKGDYVHTFTTAGTYNYTCTLHPGMDGSVTVT